MYWIMLSERSDEYQLSIEETPALIETADLRFDKGEFHAAEVPLIDVQFAMQPDETMPDNIPAYGCRGLLINAKVKQVFADLLIDNIQYFPARLVNKQTQEANEYWIANIVGAVAAIDHDQSELTYYGDGGIQFIDKLVLKPIDYAEHGHLLRLADFLPAMLVSQTLKQALQEKAITGFNFYRPSEFSL